MGDLKNKIKERLIGKIINETEYTDELYSLLYDLPVVPNTVDFDFDRIYKEGYDTIGLEGEYEHDWNEYYVCSLDVKYEDGNVKIIDVF